MSQPGGGLSIGEVARRSGVPVTTLRYYETIGLVPAPRRISGQRRYDAAVLDRLVVISVCRRVRFTLAETRELLDAMAGAGGVGGAWRALADRKLPEVDAMIEQLEVVRGYLGALSECRCTGMHECAAALRGGAAATGV